MNDMPPYNAILLERIERRIVELEKNQTGVAKKAGSEAFIRNIRRGASKYPRYDTLKKLAAELETTPDWLMGETDFNAADPAHQALSIDALLKNAPLKIWEKARKIVMVMLESPESVSAADVQAPASETDEHQVDALQHALEQSTAIELDQKRPRSGDQSRGSARKSVQHKVPPTGRKDH